MFRLAYFFKRKAGMSLEEFIEYYETRHVLISYKYLTHSATHYSRKYLRPRRAGVDRESTEPQDSPYDVFVELAFETGEEYEKTLTKLTPADIELIRADAAKFMDRGRMGFVVDEHISPIGDVRRDHLLHWRPGSDAPGKDHVSPGAKAILKSASLFKRKPGMSHDEFKQYYEARHVLIGYKYITYNATHYSRKYLRPLRLRSADPFSEKGSIEPADTPYDVFMELAFATDEDRNEVMAALRPADWDLIRADEAQFMDPGNRLAFSVDEHVSPMGEVRRHNRLHKMAESRPVDDQIWL